MARLLLFFIGLFIGFSAQAQGDNLTGLYFKNQLYFNPAAAGAFETTAVTLNARGQWFSNFGNPIFAHAYLSVEHYVPKWNSGFGLRYNFQKHGSLITESDYGLTYNYRLKFTETHFLNIGTNITLAQQHFAADKIRPPLSPEDLAAVKASEYQLDTDLGFLYKNNNFQIGISIRHLNQPRFTHNLAFGFRRTITTYINAQYDFFNAKKTLRFSPSLQGINAGPFYFIAVGGLWSYKEKIYAGFHLRPNNSGLGMAYHAGGTLFGKATILFGYEPVRIFGSTFETLLRFTF